MEYTYSNGARRFLYPNGTRKEISPDARTTVTTYFNGDLKEARPDGCNVYYYVDAHITQTTQPDGLQILEFPKYWTYCTSIDFGF